jgi:hypothetical protein
VGRDFNVLLGKEKQQKLSFYVTPNSLGLTLRL